MCFELNLSLETIFKKILAHFTLKVHNSDDQNRIFTIQTNVVKMFLESEKFMLIR